MPPAPQSEESTSPASSEQPSLNDKIADIALKVVMAGGVTGGGIGAFWSLFVNSDVPKAIASAVIGLGLSYGASLLNPLHKGNQRRLGKVGEVLDQAVDRTAEQVVAKARGVEDQYFQCQAWACRRQRSEGVAQHDGMFMPLLEEVFVPLRLDASSILPGFRALEILGHDLDRGRAIWDLLGKVDQEATFRQIVVLAWGGYGKTTLLRHIAYTYCLNQQGKYGVNKRRTPFLLVLRKYRDVIAPPTAPNPALTLPDLIMQHHLSSLPEAEALKLPSDWAKQKLERGEAVVMLDGFDEVAKSQRPVVARWINDQMRRYGKSVFIVTSRPKAYNEQDMGDRLELSTRLWVQDFDQQQRRDFVQKWYRCQERYANGGDDTPDVQHMANQAATELLAQIETRPELKDLAENPLLLNMIVTFHRRYPGADLPKRRVELYREICLLQLRDRPAARKLETLLTQCEAQTILQMLALEMMQAKKERLDRSVLLEQLAAYLRHQRETVSAKEFLEQVVQISELLVEREPDEFEFAHLSLQEYLAAVQIVQQKQEGLLYEQFADDWWKPTTLLYAALTNPTTLIETAIQWGAIDLAYACLQATLKQVDTRLRTDVEARLAALKQTVQTSRYAKLEEHLKVQQWVEADQETYRLMITAVGKEEGQYFETEELLNFPCDELRAIDGLWVEYSQGRFGFSVQKQIYVDCGGKLDGKYPGNEVWEAFGDRVGWRKEGDWIYSYEDLTKNPSLSSPQGIFPVCCLWFGFRWGVGGFGWLGCVLVSSLAQRLVNCSTPQL